MKNKKVAQRIIEMMQKDQQILKSGGTLSNDIFKENTEELKKIISEIGWPTIDKVGEEASRAAWMIAQHSDNDIPFQKKVLKLMKASPKKFVMQADIPYLEDRILVNEGKPQIYGTQIKEHIDKPEPYPIKNEEKVDERRKKFGLPPLKNYLEMLEGAKKKA